ncbi:intermembrane transport protein PqiB [Psychromonas sp. 14N.309.X.WAT.B.A12]|uniref:intermembrane transport protein PqiB n=1 Tax=unclassified Psychromonas TaxID=2614957 RepID=UPI0025B0E970|nr:intermembrane transport protein PqiB [Psychromonas sp. 14N.309.X.WAT.B.A12]MDN2664120.1 intermembrane transport protein PqiB [Psychromonas sp. 14N.309.X.WAT.B.A12]
MSDETPVQATIKKQKKISAIWIIPILALLIGAWMLFQYVNNKGTEITIIMPTAEGIKVGKTEIRSLNVKVGMVTAVTLSENYDHIEITAQMSKDSERMLNDKTQFWVVKPRVGSEGISGLETILSGAYIQIQPGDSKTKKLTFEALDLPPVAPLGSKGKRVILSHNSAGKLSVGDPVSYQGFTVGRVEKTSFDLKTKKALYQLFIFEPYDDLLLSGSQFWLTSGVDVQLNADGIKVQVDSLQSLVSGGVTFGIPSGERAGTPFASDVVKLPLFDNYEQVQNGLYKQYVKFIMEFDETIRGLTVGAPVEYRGIRIGTVLQAPYDMMVPQGDTSSVKIQVLIKIELGRLFNADRNLSLSNFRETIEKHFKSGLKGQLKSGNLLTGALFIDTEFDTPNPDFKITKVGEYDVFPTKKGGLAMIQQQISSFMDKFNDIPLNEVAGSMTKTMDSLNQTLTSANNTFDKLNEIISQKEVQAIPADVQTSLQQLQQTLAGFSPNSVMYNDLQQTLDKVEKVMLELQPVLKQINDKPNSLIFGEDQVTDPMPTKRAN